MDLTKQSPTFEWLRPARGGHGSNAATGVRVAVYYAGKARPQLSIALYKDTMQKMRWVIGDRVEVGIDMRSMCIALRRVPIGGYSLTALSVSGKKRDESQGKPCPAVTKLTAPPDLLRVFSGRAVAPFDECIEMDGMLIIPLTTPA